MNILALSAPKKNKTGYTKTYKNLQKTIFKSWNIRNIQKDNAQLISDEVLNDILVKNDNQEEIFIWGLNINNKDKGKIKSEYINFNDLVLFYGSYDGIYKQGSIVSIFMDNEKKLSNYFWNSSRYNLIIFLKDVKNVKNVDKNFVASNKLFGVSSTANEKRWGIMQKNILVLSNEKNKLNPNLFNVDIILNKLYSNYSNDEVITNYSLSNKRSFNENTKIKLINDPILLIPSENVNNNLNSFSKKFIVARTYNEIKTINEYAKDLGTRGEIAVVEYEKNRLLKQNRQDLSEKVTHVALTNENLDFDVLSYDSDGNEIYIEVKTFKEKFNKQNLRFFISEGEKNFLETHDNSFIYFVGNIESEDLDNKIQFAYLGRKELKFLIFKPINYSALFTYKNN